MSTEFCNKCRENHPGRVCDFADGECAETRTIDDKIANIKMHSEMHRHSYNDLINCCMEDGVLSSALLQAHEEAFGRGGVLRCDVVEGPCSCGAWHSGNN